MNEAKEPEVLRELWQITERRGEAVYKTVYVKDVWIPMSVSRGRPIEGVDYLYAVKSSDFDGPTIRRAK